MKLKKLVPMLNISNLEASLAFYQSALRFELVSSKEALQDYRWGVIRSGETELMLSETDNAAGLAKNVNPHEDTSWPTIFYFYPDDVEELYEFVLKQGYKPSALEVTFYGMTEFSLQDPDGHMLSFGQDTAGVIKNT